MLELGAYGGIYPCGGVSVSVSVWKKCWWRRRRSACVRAGWDVGETGTRFVRAVVCVCVCVWKHSCKCINGKEYAGRYYYIPP